MRLRAPCVPLINIDPYFSVWCEADKLNEKTTVHWTGKPNTIKGLVVIDGEELLFCGKPDMKPETEIKPIKQTAIDIDAFSTYYTFENEKIKLYISFTSPRLANDLYLASSPTAYMRAYCESADGLIHTVFVKICVSEEICLDLRGQYPVKAEEIKLGNNISCHKMGSSVQNVLGRSGDDVRIDWGYFYLAVESGTTGFEEFDDGMTYLYASSSDISQNEALFVFAYDDIYSINYFGEKLKSYWNKNGEKIEEAVLKAFSDYKCIFSRCVDFSDKMFIDAVKAGGEEYAELLQLAYRQVMAAHKICVTDEGEILYISKECFSNGCAATVDVSYPSIPMYLIYNTELVRGMVRPIFKYASSEAWPHEFAPHDAGQYPLVCGQVYNGTNISGQMPLEECGNMLIISAAVCLAEKSADFALQYITQLKMWADYLDKNGFDPENQLCTDDFAGHMAHNCNLTLKAVMGIAGYALICKMSGDLESYNYYIKRAEILADSWTVRASNGDGSYRLAFDKAGTWSMKYNAVWDVLFGTGLFRKEVLESEIASNFSRMNPYGMPLDNRATYTKSDWIVWTASMSGSGETFRNYIKPLWRAYNHTRSRVPMSDWFDTITADMVGFRHRTVQGGLFMKLLSQKSILNK